MASDGPRVPPRTPETSEELPRRDGVVVSSGGPRWPHGGPFPAGEDLPEAFAAREICRTSLTIYWKSGLFIRNRAYLLEINAAGPLQDPCMTLPIYCFLRMYQEIK